MPCFPRRGLSLVTWSYSSYRLSRKVPVGDRVSLGAVWPADPPPLHGGISGCLDVPGFHKPSATLRTFVYRLSLLDCSPNQQMTHRA